jgi:hypothetical protein
MLERLDWQKVGTFAGGLTAATEPEETLVHDVRAHLTPAQMVENKLTALLKSSDPSPFPGPSELLRGVESEQNASFRMLDAMQEGRQRAASDRGLGIRPPRRMPCVSYKS